MIFKNRYFFFALVGVFALISFSACGKKPETVKNKKSSESIVQKTEIAENSSPTTAPIASTAEKPKVELDTGLLEELSKTPHPEDGLSKLRLDTSSTESFLKSLNDEMQEFCKLPEEQRKAMLKIFDRYVMELLQANPKFFEFMEGLKSKTPQEAQELFFDFLRESMKVMNGKNFYEVIDQGEAYLSNKDPISDEELLEFNLKIGRIITGSGNQ